MFSRASVFRWIVGLGILTSLCYIYVELRYLAPHRTNAAHLELLELESHEMKSELAQLELLPDKERANQSMHLESLRGLEGANKEADSEIFETTLVHRTAETLSQTEHVAENQDSDFMDKMSQRMRERKELLRTACKRLGLLNEKPSKMRVLLAEKYKFAYCYIPKTGCSNMKRILMELNGHTDLAINDIHQLSLKLYEKHGEGMPEIAVQQNFTKLLLVRHPYERLVSSYNNKVRPANLQIFTAISEKMREMYGNATRSKETGKTALFEEFVDYISDGHNIASVDGGEDHWNNFNSICQPCLVDYDVIAHLETVEEDSRYLLKLIGAPPGMEFNSGYSKSGESQTADKNLVERFMTRLTSGQVKKLDKAYESDFELFGYSTNYTSRNDT